MRTIVAIAIVSTMVIPAVMTAQTINFDYTQETHLLEMLEANIEGGEISFDTEAHKQSFLSGISSVYSHRDAENWSTCVTLCDGLATAAVNWIEVDDVASTASALCSCVADIYEEDEETFNTVMIDSDDNAEIDDALNDLYGKGSLPLAGQVVHLYLCQNVVHIYRP